MTILIYIDKISITMKHGRIIISSIESQVFQSIVIESNFLNWDFWSSKNSDAGYPI